ncbi:glycosyltransferase family 4 protein [bacterium]|nr:glycosyltransferase family 4 protein [bacterium]MBU1152367.1 glycosyltransferase family 4 protein [bacterium]MBU2599840.1 glycosyltransferase family 4 protein [bacterium]
MNIIDKYLTLSESKDQDKEKKIDSLLKEPRAKYLMEILSLGLNAYQGKDYQESLAYLALANKLSGYESCRLLETIYVVGETTGDFTEVLNAIVKFARQAFKSQRFDLALEAYSVIYAELFSRKYDPQGLDEDLSKEAEEAYREITGVCKKKIAYLLKKPTKKKDKINLAHVVGNLIDDTHSPSKLVKGFINFHDYERFNLSVFSSEVYVKRDNPCFPVYNTLPSSYRRAPKLVSLMKEKKVKFFATPVDGSQTESALILAQELISNDIDIAIFHSSMASSIDCIVAGLKTVPLQIVLSHGGDVRSGGIDAVLYLNETPYEVNKDYWKKRGVKAFSLEGFFDVDEELKGTLPKKEEFNIPKEAKVLITASNHLEKRLSEEFLEVVVKILKENKEAYYLVVGRGNLDKQKDLLQRAGVVERVIFTGPRQDAPLLIKMADVYLNEFPAGGGFTTLEAMAAKKPIAAMNYSQEHTQCIAANYIGKDLAIKSKDYQGYLELTNKLIRDEEYRLSIGEKMRKRYEEKHSPLEVVRDYEEVILKLYQNAL